ncbi:MAG: MerR family transcriptional regulator [Anaerolineales bacterium]|nr:MerR family transcriptional regulator [Anaerolineales bacterium]MCB0027309.1 MerR family transcriptional regulator [Anaerolineales bacterium]
MLIGEFAQQTGLPAKTIRYYEEIGLLPLSSRLENGYRVYDESDVARANLVAAARALDFSLDDIQTILDMHSNRETPCLFVTDLVAKQLTAIDAKIAALILLRDELEGLQRRAQSISIKVSVENEYVCHLIENREIVEK